MKKADLFKTYRNYLNGMQAFVEEYGKDKRIAIDQAYGYTMGITACNERYYNEITAIWEEWRNKMIWEVVQGTEETAPEKIEAAAQEEPEQDNDETQEEEAAEAQEEEAEGTSTTEGAHAMKILVDDMKVRQMCINESYYTRGNNEEYSHMIFDMCGEAHTVEEVKAIAEDIAAHSDIEEKMNSYGVTEEQMILIITENIINECSYISLGIF